MNLQIELFYCITLFVFIIQAKEMVEKSPIVVKQGLKKDEAEKLKAAILEAGGKAELL